MHVKTLITVDKVAVTRVARYFRYFLSSTPKTCQIVAWQQRLIYMTSAASVGLCSLLAAPVV